MKQTLNKVFLSYKKNEIDRNELEGLIYSYLLNNQEKTRVCHWNRDEYEDFISWFYPRLKRAIDSYAETGSSFEAYIAKYLLISSKEYHVKTVTKSVIEYSAWSARVPDMYVYEETQPYLQKETKQVLSNLVIERKGRKESRRVLALILKCYYFISDDFAEKTAPLIGINPKELVNKLHEIRDIRHKKDDRIFEMKEKIHRQFYRCIVNEKRLLHIKENTAAYAKLEARAKRDRSRLEKMRESMGKIKIEATNKEIAEVIGVTKGAVDASLCRLKSKWESMSKKADSN
ncbi:MAG: hypothetical protein FWC21_04980 [Treponema sp.]|nr:hypothetical protein [Treponema sp.]